MDPTHSLLRRSKANKHMWMRVYCHFVSSVPLASSCRSKHVAQWIDSWFNLAFWTGQESGIVGPLPSSRIRNTTWGARAWRHFEITATQWEIRTSRSFECGFGLARLMARPVGRLAVDRQASKIPTKMTATQISAPFISRYVFCLSGLISSWPKSNFLHSSSNHPTKRRKNSTQFDIIERKCRFLRSFAALNFKKGLVSATRVCDDIYFSGKKRILIHSVNRMANIHRYHEPNKQNEWMNEQTLLYPYFVYHRIRRRIKMSHLDSLFHKYLAADDTTGVDICPRPR